MNSDILNLAIFLLSSVYAHADCFDTVALKYQYDPDYLRAIAKNESEFNPKAIGYNNDGSIDLGLMQINSSNLEWLRRKFPKISINKLLLNTCFNIHVAGYILNENFKLYGRKWIAVGVYNAGSKNNPKRVKIRYEYALKVSDYYKGIKKGKIKTPHIIG